MQSRLLLILFACMTLSSGVSSAATYPDRPVRFIVQFPPGGGTDAFGRIVGSKLTELWGQQVIIDNRSGAQGNIGTALGAKASPDGYTITLAHQGALVINPHLYGNPGFDTLRDFAAVSRGMETPSILVVNPGVSAKSMKELAELARQNPGKLTFASTASLQQLLGELFKLTTHTNIVHVPYKGAGPAVIDLLGGHVSMMFANPSSIVPNVKAGKLRALAVLGARRNEALPDVPTIDESGLKGFDVTGWYGLFARAGTPLRVISILQSNVAAVVNAPQAREQLDAWGLSPVGSTPEAFGEFVRREMDKYARIAREANIPKQ